MRNIYYLLGILTRMKQLFGGAGLFLIAFLATMTFLIYTADAFTGTMSNVAASRAFDTTYQNTSSEDILVMASARNNSCGSGTIQLQALIGSASANTDVLAASGRDNSTGCEAAALSFIVPADWYYRVNSNSNAGISEFGWWEYETPAMSGGGGGGTTTEMVILSGTTTTNNPTQDMFNGILLFGFVMIFFIWFFRRPYDTY